jgi:outer membrane protein assembly factor BamD (BamD/ComL family)
MRILISIIILLASSCVSNKYSYTPKKYNGNQAIVEINGVGVKKKQTFMGYTIQAASVLSGVYVGYKLSPIVTNYKANGNANKSAVAGAGIGGLIGFGINNSVNSLLGKGNSFKLEKNDKYYNGWFNNFNKRNNYVQIDLHNTWLYMDKTKESSYQIKTFEDLKFFHEIFPSSQYTDEKITQALNVFDRNSIELAIPLFSSYSIKEKLIAAFLEKSLTASQVFDVINKFPGTTKIAEKKLSTLVSEKEEILSFVGHYPNSAYKENLQTKINNSASLFNSFSKTELILLLKYFNIKDNSSKNKFIEAIIDRSLTFSEISDDLINFPEFKSQIELNAAGLVNDLSTHNLFISSFPNSKYIHVFEDGFIDVEKGTIVSTQWDLEKNIPPNFNKVIFKSAKELYNGSYYNGKKSGYGTLDTTPEDNKTKIHYEGYFSYGKFSGEGKYSFGDGTYTRNSHTCNISYSGQFKNNLFDGHGSASGILGECYSWFSDNYASYTGGWKEGKFHGTGKYTYGEMWYEGGFENGAMNGQGMLRMPNGIRIEGPWKNQSPNGRMHIFKFTLGGLIREDDYKDAYSFKELSSVESSFIDKWNNSRSSSRESANSKRQEEKDKENQEKRIKKDKESATEIEECAKDINKSLKKVTLKEEGVFSDCPCLYYEDPDFLGYRLELKENNENEWYYKVTALLNFKGWQGP